MRGADTEYKHTTSQQRQRARAPFRLISVSKHLSRVMHRTAKQQQHQQQQLYDTLTHTHTQSKSQIVLLLISNGVILFDVFAIFFYNLKKKNDTLKNILFHCINSLRNIGRFLIHKLRLTKFYLFLLFDNTYVNLVLN